MRLINQLPERFRLSASETALAYFTGDIIARHSGTDRLDQINLAPPFQRFILVRKEVDAIAVKRGTPTFTELQNLARHLDTLASRTSYFID